MIMHSVLNRILRFIDIFECFNDTHFNIYTLKLNLLGIRDYGIEKSISFDTHIATAFFNNNKIVCSTFKHSYLKDCNSLCTKYRVYIIGLQKMYAIKSISIVLHTFNLFQTNFNMKQKFY